MQRLIRPLYHYSSWLQFLAADIATKTHMNVSVPQKGTSVALTRDIHRNEVSVGLKFRVDWSRTIALDLQFWPASDEKAKGN